MRQELQLVGSGSSLVENREGSDVLVIKLLLGSRKVKVGSVQPHLVANLIVTGGAFLLVVLHFHVVGGFFQGITSLLVDLRHGHGEFCGCRVREW